jgi:uncharacterized membrane protein (UPF0127 family)
MTFAALLALAACGHSSPCHVPPAKVLLRGAHGTVSLDVDVARTAAQRARGLTGRTSLPSDAGMLFAFDAPSDAAFWMKDTLIPLSIAFYDRGGRIVAIREMRPCPREPCALYRSTRPYVGAIEANRGYFARHGIGIGDRVRPRVLGCA